MRMTGPRLPWLCLLAAVLLLIGASLSAGHGHLGGDRHDGPCAACALSSAPGATPPSLQLGSPSYASVPLRHEITGRETPLRAPLSSAPKHGPPSRPV